MPTSLRGVGILADAEWPSILEATLIASSLELPSGVRMESFHYIGKDANVTRVAAMATVFIPMQLRHLAEGAAQVEVPGETVREVVAALEQRFPGMEARLCSGGRLVPQLQVTIDNQLSQRGLLAKVGPESEVHFLPAIGGG